MRAWYCASKAKIVAVGPDGRWFIVFRDNGRSTRARRIGGRRVVYGNVDIRNDYTNHQSPIVSKHINQV